MYNAVFLDRDGTIIEDVGYLDTIDDIVFIDGVFEALRRLRKAGFKLAVVTNQSGVARGYFKEEFVHAAHRHIAGVLEKEGIGIDGFYHCPHYAQGAVAEYAIACDCRKPQTGMARKAQRDLNLHLAGSYMIGDHYSDVRFGHNAGMKSIFLFTGHGNTEWARRDEWEAQPDYAASDITAAAAWILRDREGGAG